MKRVRISVYGQVQGVGFRYYAMLEAQRLELVGFVKNERNGSVTIEVQGERDDLEAFMRWCSAGPDAAAVEKCDVVNIPVGDETKFRIF